MYAAVDIATGKVSRQLRKYKTRVIDHRDRTKIAEVPLDPAKDPEVIAAAEAEEAVVRYKYVDLVPLTEEEALLQTDLLGHDFFVYIDKETNLVNVMYHRHGGGYGIIKPAVNE
jgi:putative sigma-54 modulation protein